MADRHREDDNTLSECGSSRDVRDVHDRVRVLAGLTALARALLCHFALRGWLTRSVWSHPKARVKAIGWVAFSNIDNELETGNPGSGCR